MMGGRIGGANGRLNIGFAWGLMLLVSDLPDALFRALGGEVPKELPLAKIALLAASLALCALEKRLRPLRPFAIVLLVLFVALGVSDIVGRSAWWQGHFGGETVSFERGYTGLYIRDGGVALVVAVALLLLRRGRSRAFLVKGEASAPIGPVRWLGIKPGESWRTFGWIFALAAAVLVALPTVLAVRPAPGALGRVAGLLPAVLLFAAVNALNEEVYFRASFLSTLEDAVGRGNAILIAAVFFGMSHYLYGSPPGLVGFLMTAFLGWLLGKSMIETRGMLWPWIMHFLPDVVVFTSYALTWAPR